MEYFGGQTMESAEPQAGPEDPFVELPLPVTPLEAKRVWGEQRRSSARSVAKATISTRQAAELVRLPSQQHEEDHRNARLGEHHVLVRHGQFREGLAFGGLGVGVDRSEPRGIGAARAAQRAGEGV